MGSALAALPQLSSDSLQFSSDSLPCSLRLSCLSSCSHPNSVTLPLLPPSPCLIGSLIGPSKEQEGGGGIAGKGRGYDKRMLQGVSERRDAQEKYKKSKGGVRQRILGRGEEKEGEKDKISR